MRMQEIDIHDYARQLFDARGDKAVVEAAQKARSLEEQGQREEVETWRHIEAALKQMRGPHESRRCADGSSACSPTLISAAADPPSPAPRSNRGPELSG
jgi:hypothetical protein